MLTPLLPFSLPGLVVAHVSTAAPMLLIDAPTSTPTACCPDCHAPSARVPSPLYTPAARSARRRAAGAPPRACPAFPVFYIHLAAPHVCGAPPGAGSGPGPADGAVDGDAPGPRRRGRRPSGRTPGDSPAAARAWRHRPPAPPEAPGASPPPTPGPGDRRLCSGRNGIARGI